MHTLASSFFSFSARIKNLRLLSLRLFIYTTPTHGEKTILSVLFGIIFFIIYTDYIRYTLNTFDRCVFELLTTPIAL